MCSSRAHARIIGVDTNDALSLRGVHGYIDHKDIQGKNKFGINEHDEEIFASEIVRIPISNVPLLNLLLTIVSKRNTEQSV